MTQEDALIPEQSRGSSFMPGRSLRKIAAMLLALAAATSWILLRDDGPIRGTAVLGLYRDRNFVVAAGLTYLALWSVLLAWLSPSRRALFALGAFHGSLACLVVCIEAAAWTGFLEIGRWLPLKRRVVSAPSRVYESQLQGPVYRDSILEAHVPGDMTTIFGAPCTLHFISIRTDSLGFRNKGDKSSSRVLCLGDSILVSGFVPQEELVTERLERGLGVGVMNVSAPGYCPQEAFRRFQNASLEAHGRLVLQFVFGGNDLEDSRSWRVREEQSPATHRPRAGFSKRLLAQLHRPRVGVAHRRRGIFRDVHGADIDVYFLYDSSRTRGFMDELGNLIDDLGAASSEVLASGGQYGVVYVPPKLFCIHELCTWPRDSELGDPDLALDEFAPALERACQARGIPFFDTTPALKSAAALGRLPYFPDDTHLNSYGHQVLSDALTPWVAWLLALGAK